MVYAVTGNAARAREILANLKAEHKDKYYPYHVYAWIHAALGEKDEAFFWLERALPGANQASFIILRSTRWPDPLRDDQTFCRPPPPHRAGDVGMPWRFLGRSSLGSLIDASGRSRLSVSLIPSGYPVKPTPLAEGI